VTVRSSRSIGLLILLLHLAILCKKLAKKRRALVNLKQHLDHSGHALRVVALLLTRLHLSYVSIRQHVSAYVSMRVVALLLTRLHLAYVSIRQHSSAYVSRTRLEAASNA
jgi:hypothetical protein